MCGLTGLLGGRPEGGRPDDRRAALERAARAISHRGPDDAGYWEDPAARIALAHRRLSIQDLSAAGHQPMASPDARWIVVYNGEIYNHMELRAALERECADGSTGAAAAPEWRGHADTETLLHCIGRWGVERTLERLVGMFAIALWDRASRELWLARDRLGEKPLYYGWVGGALAFASELKALRALPGFDAEVDREALAGMMSFNATPGTRSIHRGISKLAPGCLLRVSVDDVDRARLPAPVAWWRLEAVAQAGIASPARFASDDAAVDALEGVLGDAVQSQMISDVPLGAFLSGGIDSSTIVALMQRRSARPVKTFTIGFHEREYNEAEHASAVARHLGTEHHELYVGEAEARDVIPLLPTMYCEPFADLSQIPTYLVSRLARSHVTVSLSGDAGDELFGGYSRYFLANRIWSKLSRVPAPLRRPLASALKAVSVPAWDRLAAGIGSALPARYRSEVPGHKIHRGAELLGMRDFRTLYGHGITTLWEPGLVIGDRDGGIPPMPEPPAGSDRFEQMMLQDMLAYLPDDILVKVDRAAMAVSLETRVPMLDRRVVEFAWRLPLHYKVRGDTGKWLLREVLARHVPRALFERPKMGFGVPLDVWLRGPLRDWAEHLLDESRLRSAGYFDPAPIRRRWAEHQTGRRNWQYHLWPVLMFEAWRDATH
ncbi:MAG: asparagine synthase (glutamine-hydrolyzing) [Lautropia sp.]